MVGGEYLPRPATKCAVEGQTQHLRASQACKDSPLGLGVDAMASSCAAQGNQLLCRAQGGRVLRIFA